MPNWKTYDSSVRLLSAIVAAHPELKLNYNEISKCFGGDATTSAMENRFRRIKTDAKLIREKTAHGIDPITLPIGDTDGTVAVKGRKNGASGDTASNAGTPKKPRTPKKSKVHDDRDEEDEDINFSPSKKGNLNKVKGGRIAKASKKNTSFTSQMSLDSPVRGEQGEDSFADAFENDNWGKNDGEYDDGQYA